ncbi:MULTISPECIES: alkyl hydroperoxide reductase subunit F [Psychrobacter]|jgi:NADH-dependent peroxiredoxin subunit F|uniref:alkyl hydroperoxide reductase subunit F n=1 Tax=Psychrobacter TaxID=497 RepID=UPI00070A30A9|nr:MULTISPECIES: alkyl hydroperoxide reductase subunit F [Psychrobacter]KRG32993.1 NADH dehydrogenase [Psychrobacter sp. P11G3]MBA6244677.1 alkyl hydroperoxide reductase subunit F [Psychrobacter sp. Urea-trap-18]MBA6285846.1 alkyl hydroperoxide reductase subunit F [Psychrobacter sp. Urea-trap-16]MBA6318682.1 alkyl hydroperoxide reductase subunit F [Psychrobacter sp. Urea-trap-20]MBA6334931.1 alkyl hydroperoxide reductase subunit F [Psychrobacter sp. Urea-trap-19]|tara:strand:- start:107678 stop:109255 length:1578 start_codon:yes stop_codon:yes gene_type:complete
MIDQNLLDAVKSYSENMTRPITFVLGNGTHAKRAELVDFLTKIAGTTDKINFDAEATDDSLPSAISFKVVSHIDGASNDTGIVFSGIPGGHEFTSLILAILQAGGHTLKLDEGIQKLVKRFNKPLQFQTYVSLSCHSCPEVVQALNQFALLNDGISNEMIDGALFQEQVEANKIQGVPAVFLNGKPFANGLIDTAKLIGKLQEQFPDLLSEVEDDAEQLEQQDVTIIGAGPAGVAAAIYTARKGLKVTMVADRIGGQVKDTQDIENLISVPLTNGTDLSTNFVKHLAEYNITLKEHVSVKEIGETEEENYSIHLNTGETFNTRSIILATGAQWRKLGVPGEEENIGKGVAFCAHCDGPFFKGKDISVIGGGNSGVEAALDLAGIVNHVTVLEFADELKADQVLINKAKEKTNIEFITGAATQEIKATDGKVSSIVYQDRSTGETHERDLSGVFVQIGLVPNTGFIKGFVDLNRFGEIEIDERCRTDRKGIFACGDVTTVPFKQINIAMGEGSKAALSAFEYLVMQ